MLVYMLILAVAILLGGLIAQICIASWNIRRAGRYRTKWNCAEDRASVMEKRVEQITEKFRAMDKYATDISWLLNFLYNRYEKFADIDKELEEGIKDVPDGTSVAEVDKKVQDMKRALKLIKVTVRASNKINEFMSTIATQIGSIIQELEVINSDDEDKDNEEEKTPESPPSEQPPENVSGISSEESSESKSE